MRVWIGGIALLLAACGDSEKSDDTADAGSDGVDLFVCEPESTAVASDPNNYSYEVDIEIASVAVEALTDATLCWNDVTRDIRGRPLDPMSLYQVTISRLTLTADEVQAAVIENTLDQSVVADIRMLNLVGDFAGATCAQLSQFTIIGNPFFPEFDLPEDPETTWLASLWDINDYGRNEILLSTMFEPLTASDNHAIDMNDSSTVLTFDVDLGSLAPLAVCDDHIQVTLDWSAVTVDASGKPWDARANDTLLIGKVAGTVEDAEASFIQLYEEAEQIWTMEVYGLTQAALLDDGSIAAVDDEGRTRLPRTLGGEPFTGFSTDGTWLVGVECSTCTSPAPTFLTVVEVTGG